MIDFWVHQRSFPESKVIDELEKWTTNLAPKQAAEIYGEWEK